jgi:hypothetical protein
MELRINVGDRQVMLILAVITGVSMVGLAIVYTPSQMGHGPADIGPGTFYGGGNYIFPANSNVNVQSSLFVGNNLSVTKNITAGDITGNSIKIICPSGFISVESHGRQLGCIQKQQQTAATCQNAILNCFDSYGGKLPTYNEIYIAFQRFSSSLSGAGTAVEWTDVGYYDYAWLGGSFYMCGVIDTSANSFGPSGSSYTSSNAYRCWISA